MSWKSFGAALLIEPYLESVVLAGNLLHRAGGTYADRLASEVSAGDRVVVPAWNEPQSRHGFDDLSTTLEAKGSGWVLSGRKVAITGAPWASHFLVVAAHPSPTHGNAGISVAIVDRETEGVSTIDYPTIDGRRASDIIFQGVEIPADALLGEPGGARQMLEQIFDEAVAALCAEAVGVMKRLHEDTIEYTKSRRQFGQPIASFQVLQHRMVDMLLEIEMAVAATQRATLSLGLESVDRGIAASAAKATISKACRFVGQSAVQLLGGMGMTLDTPITHYFKRATVMETALGSADYHIGRYSRLAQLSKF